MNSEITGLRLLIAALSVREYLVQGGVEFWGCWSEAASGSHSYGSDQKGVQQEVDILNLRR